MRNMEADIAKICSKTFEKICTLFAEKQYDEVVCISDNLIAMLEKNGLDETIEYSEAMEWFGRAEFHRGNYAMAEAGFSFAYNVRAKILGNDLEKSNQLLLKLKTVRLIRKKLEQSHNVTSGTEKELL